MRTVWRSPPAHKKKLTKFSSELPRFALSTAAMDRDEWLVKTESKGGARWRPLPRVRAYTKCASTAQLGFGKVSPEDKASERMRSGTRAHGTRDNGVPQSRKTSKEMPLGTGRTGTMLILSLAIR